MSCLGGDVAKLLAQLAQLLPAHNGPADSPDPWTPSCAVDRLCAWRGLTWPCISFDTCWGVQPRVFVVQVKKRIMSSAAQSSSAPPAQPSAAPSPPPILPALLQPRAPAGAGPVMRTTTPPPLLAPRVTAGPRMPPTAAGLGNHSALAAQVQQLIAAQTQQGSVGSAHAAAAAALAYNQAIALQAAAAAAAMAMVQHAGANGVAPTNAQAHVANERADEDDVSGRRRAKVRANRARAGRVRPASTDTVLVVVVGYLAATTFDKHFLIVVFTQALRFPTKLTLGGQGVPWPWPWHYAQSTRVV
jgi:hypothetical protein